MSYLPYFISMVVAMGMVVNFLNPQEGILNVVAGDGWARNRSTSSTTRNGSGPCTSCPGIWQNFGFNAILYLAAITGIDPQLYEAATIDGATQLQKIRTSPCRRSCRRSSSS